MTVEYHINPFDGEPRKCNAKKKDCPWGKHYSSKTEAREAYESIHESEKIKTFKKVEKDIEREQERNPEIKKVKKQKRTFLNIFEISKIDVSGIECPHCNNTLNQYEASTILDYDRTVNCHSCRKAMDIETVMIEVGKQKSTYPAYEKENVYKMSWYHSTIKENWEESLDSSNSFYAHLGSPQASFDRQIAENPEKGFWLYEVRIKETANIDDEVTSDENKNYNKMRDSDDSDNDPNVFRYVNKWEDMASISLAANSKQIEVIDKRFVEPEESLKSLSLYNVKLF